MKSNLKGLISYLILSIVPLLFIGTSALISNSMYASYDLKDSLEQYSYFAWILISLGFLTYILNLLLGLVSRLNRFVLLVAFKIGTILTFITTPILILGQCAFGIGILYYLCAFYFSRIPAGIMLSIALAGGAVALILLRNMFKILNKKMIVKGLLVTSREQPKLWKIVEEVTREMDIKLPDNLIVYFGDNYFVTQAPVVCFSGVVTGRTLVISLPCLYKFTESEFKAILVHEFSHFQGLDTLYSMYFYNSWRRLADAYVTVNAGDDVASLFTASLLSSFMNCFIKPKAYFDRLREREADLNAAKLISNTSIGSALVKLTWYSVCWSGVEKEKINARTEGKYITNESKIFNIICDNLTNNKDKKDIITKYLSSETNVHTGDLDDHPCLKERLEYLNIKYDKAKDCLKETKLVPVVNVFNKLPDLEEDLSKYDASI